MRNDPILAPPTSNCWIARASIHSVGETLRFKYQTSRSGTKRGSTEVQKLSNNFLCQNQYLFCERVPISKRQCRPMMAMMCHRRANNSGIGISKVRSLPSLDITGLAASPLTFPGGLACHARSNQLVGGNVMSRLTGGEQAKCCSRGWSQSQSHRVQSHFQSTFNAPNTTKLILKGGPEPSKKKFTRS